MDVGFGQFAAAAQMQAMVRGGITNQAVMSNASGAQYLEAQVAMGGGGLQVSGDAMLRGGVNAQFAVGDSFAMMGAQGGFGAYGATGTAGLDAFVTNWYNAAPQAMDPYQSQMAFEARLGAVGGLNNSAEMAFSMGAIDPSQFASIQMQTGDFSAFAQAQIGGPGVSASFSVNMGDMFAQQQMMSQLQSQQGFLMGLGMADQMLAQRMGMQEANFAQFGGMVQNQLGQLHGQMGMQDQALQQLYGQMGHFGTQLQSHSQGIGDLASQLGQLNGNLGNLGGVVSGLEGKLGGLDAAFGQYRMDNDAALSGLGASVDARFGGVNSDMKRMLDDLNALRSELAAAKAETADLRGMLGAEAGRLDGRIDTLEGKVDTEVVKLNEKIDSGLAGVFAKIDVEVARLDAKDAALGAELTGLKDELTTFKQTAMAKFEEHSAAIADAKTEIANVKTNLTAEMANLETRLQAAITAGDTALQAQITDQQAQLKTIEGQVAAHETRITTAEGNLTQLSGRVDAAMNTATQALGEARDAKGLAERLRGTVNDLKGDVKQLFANDHSFSELLSQWHGALDWRWGHILVNQKMEGNSHTRFDPLFVKFGAGDFDFSAAANTKMVTGAEARLRWPADTQNTAALVLDPAELKKLGYTLMNARGDEITEKTMFKDMMRLRGPDGKEKLAADGWKLMKELDANNDGKVTSADPAARAIQLWFDSGATAGSIDAKDRLTNFLDSGILEVGVEGKNKRQDAFGNQLNDGEIKLASGAEAKITDAFFREAR